MFLLVPAYPGCPGQTAVKWLLLLSIIIETCYQLNSTKVDSHSMINWTVVSQQVYSTCDC